MVTRIPDAPTELLPMIAALARSVKNVQREVDKGDVWMAHAYSLSLLTEARLVVAGVQEWNDSTPPDTGPALSPHHKVALRGSTMSDAVSAMCDHELLSFWSQMAWERHYRTNPETMVWLGRAEKLADAEISQRGLRRGGRN